MKNLNSYVSFMGKCSHQEYDSVQNIILEIVKRYDGNFSIHRDISEQNHIAFASTIFVECNSIEDFSVISKSILDEIDRKMFVHSTSSGKINHDGWTC